MIKKITILGTKATIRSTAWKLDKKEIQGGYVIKGIVPELKEKALSIGAVKYIQEKNELRIFDKNLDPKTSVQFFGVETFYIE